MLRVLDIAVELAVGFATLDHAPARTSVQFRRLAPWFGLLWMPWFGLGAILYGLAAVRSLPGSVADVTTPHAS